MSWLPAAELAGVLLAGLAAGWVASVLIGRIPGGRGPWPPVRCPHCQHAVAIGDILPVASWLVLRGRCRVCRGSLGAWYPAAELITAGLFVALWLRFGPVPVLPALAYLAVLSVVLGFIDARYQRLPDVLTLPAYPIALAGLGLAAPFARDGLRHLLGALIGMAIAWLLFFLQALIYPAGIGWGDVKLSGVLGLYLGWFGATALIYGIAGGYLLGALAGLGLIAARRATSKTRLAFGPYLLIATMAVILAAGGVGSLF